MVYRMIIDEDQWNEIKPIEDRYTFASKLLSCIGPMEDIQRIEIRLPSTVTKDERHSIYKLNTKSLFKSVVIYDDNERENCMFIFMSKKYVASLTQHNLHDHNENSLPNQHQLF